MANTPNFALYKPNRADTSVEVDTSLADNFTKIDTELQNNKGGLATHITDPNAHTSENISHADGSVKSTLDNHEERLGNEEIIIGDLNTRVTDIETLGLDVLAPNLEGRIQTIESDVEGILAPATFDAMDQQSYTFDEYRIGYVENKLGERGFNLKSLGLKGNGTTDDTTALSDALNSATMAKFFAPKGDYVLTNTITVNSTLPKVIEGTEGTVFKITLSSSLTLFDLLTNVTFKNVVLDFSNSYCKNAMLYRANFGEVKLYNIEIRNVKDIDTTTSSALINILADGNKIDLEKITFKNILKRGNGNITDGAGSINGIYYNGTITTPSALGGSIRNVYIENLHNIDASDAVILEDTTGIYISLSGKKSNVKIYDVNGLEYGKRLLKIQASDIDIDKVRGESTTGDSLSVIGALSEPGVFSSDDVRISNVIAKGNMDYAIAVSASNTTIRDTQIDLSGSNALNSGTNHFGIHLSDGADNARITKTKIKSKRPIGLFNSTSILKNISLEDVEITLTANAGGAVTQLFNSAFGYDGLYLNNIKVKMDVAPTGSPSFILTETTFTGRNKNLTIHRVNVDASDPVSGTYCKSAIGTIRFVDTVNIKDVTYNNTAVGTQASDLLSVLDSTDVALEGIKTLVKSNRTLLLQRLTALKVKEQNLDGEAITGHVVLIDTTRTEIDSKNEKYKIVYGTQDATEVLRNKGTTAQRPKRAYQSFRYYDTTLNKDIVVKTGAVIATDFTVTTNPVWVDAMGTIV